MRDRLLAGGLAMVRLVLVVVAFGLAVGSIAVSSARGFCPEVEAQALAMPPLATIVESPSAELDAEAPAEDAPAEDAPAEEDPGTPPADAGGGECPGGVQRCLPPLFSSVLILGESACHDQAGSELRSRLVPAFVGSTVLLAAAWWLRPTRLQARREERTSRPGPR